MSTFEYLKTFYAIAWDVDETLIDNPISSKLHLFIHENPDIKHYIVTFRTGGMVNAIPYDMQIYGTDMSVFSGVFSIPYDYWLADQEAKYKKLKLWRENEEEDDLPLSDAEIRYREWKGLICHQHSIPVLIDDNIEETAPGCDKYNIVLINPFEMYYGS